MNVDELVGLTASQVATFVADYPKESKEKIVEKLEYLSGRSQRGDNIPQGVYDYIRSKHYVNLLKTMGYIKCQYSGEMANEAECQVIYKGYSAFVNGEKSYIKNKYVDDSLKGGNCMKDEILDVVFLDRAQTVYDTDMKAKKVSAGHASYKVDSGVWHYSTVSRRTKIYSTFNTNFFAHGASPKDWAIPEGDTVGTEIEMLFPDLESKLRFSSWVGQNFPGWYCEYDGSLEDYGNAGNCGCELISPPLLVKDMYAQITTICEKAVEFGGQGFQAGVFYGMHVTMLVPKSSRGGPSRNTIASRYIAMFNNPKLRSFWQLVARRKGESFNQYCPFKDVSLDTCLATEQGGGGRGEAHRRAVFVRNPTLLETRIFRSNLSAIQVRANIEICDLVMKYCKSNTFDLDKVKNFYDFLQAEMSKDLRACLYRKKNTPIRVLNELMMESEIDSEPELVGLSY